MVEVSNLYQAKCRRSGDWWAVEVVDGLAGGTVLHTQARRLRQVDAVAKDALALLYEADPESFAIARTVVLDDATDKLLAERRKARARAKQAASEAARADIDAAHALVDAGITLRDAGDILEVSFQRVGQLVEAPRA
jgi:hypothetical protein